MSLPKCKPVAAHAWLGLASGACRVRHDLADRLVDVLEGQGVVQVFVGQEVCGRKEGGSCGGGITKAAM